MVQDQKAPVEKPKKRKGCFLWGCLTVVGIIVVVALGLSITVFKVPQKIGLVKPATERLLSQTPDRQTALSLKTDFQKAGISTKGVDLYVIPEKNTDNKSVLLAVLDSSKGFYFSTNGTQDAISDYLVKLAKTSSTYGIERVAFQYLDSDGQPVVAVTASTNVILKYSSGQMSKTDFMKAIDAKLDISEIAKPSFP
jgi:hypothetical protein